MPELPELEVVQEVLNRRLVGHTISRVEVDPKGGPLVVRDQIGRGLAEALIGQTLQRVERRGKYLLFHFNDPQILLLANPKLTGRFQLCAPDEKKPGPVHVVIHFHEFDQVLRYVDQKRMGQLYLTDSLGKIPAFNDMGPDALATPLEEFRRRLRTFRGEIKGILTRERFLSGIGNAYADEILWQARIHPFRKRTDLSEEEVDRLYEAVLTTLRTGTERVREGMGEQIHLKPRDFFAVHMQKDEACPRCGTRVSAITAQGRVTNFCRSCQPGGLFRGM